LRHLLKATGHDVTKIKQRNMVQEDLGLRDLIEQLRSELNSILHERHVADIDRLFIDRNGPEIRDRLSHGLMDHGEPFGADAVYACWLIYRLVVVPILPRWQAIFGEAILPTDDDAPSSANQ
jgi:hypothetical protein